ncbi:MAG: hypothetical protein AVDCRST_MAG62-435 [uncultured Sphingomonas sp.]|uniref:Uncharacterized protein n=1 Tax=uncultured Sphingomonas sp. TaxID=158754 RepID=A0A6J4SYY9_9SPHN|nr:MAG: hypothetical protein AVDCRST_MAG62-435 [uncultured Sphingomonas sp.]
MSRIADVRFEWNADISYFARAAIASLRICSSISSVFVAV